MIKLILASRSPRRRELIRLLDYPFQTVAADVDEDSITHSDPAVNVIKTARLKGVTIANQVDDNGHRDRLIVVAADTTVSLDGQMLGKPFNESDARCMLKSLRDRTHQVHTGITLIDTSNGRQLNDVHTAVVTMRSYSDEEIDAYIRTGDPMDKAGAYAIQHPGFRPVTRIAGCFTGVMGLSICHLLQLLERLQIPRRVDLRTVSAAHLGYHCPLYDELRHS